MPCRRRLSNDAKPRHLDVQYPGIEPKTAIEAMTTRGYYRDISYGYSDAITWGVQRLIVINTLVFAIQLLIHIPFGGIAGPPGGIIVDWLQFSADKLFSGAVWQPFTYMFLHANLMHLFLNMLWLYFFGPDVERVLGTRQFLRFYVICGALAVLATLIPTLIYRQAWAVSGASGAVMAVMVAFAVINPTRELFLFPLPIPINARWLVLIIIGMNILSALDGGGNVSVSTHLGGIAVGYAYMKLVPLLRARQRTLWKDKKDKRDPVGDAVDNIFKFEDRKGPRPKP